MYYRVCETLTDYGKFIPANDTISTDNKKDWYRSIYLYNEEQKKQAEEVIEVTENGTTRSRPRGVSGIKEVTTTELVWDFDSKSDLSKAKKDTKILVKRLQDSGINGNDLYVFFSGGKGFHVHVWTNTKFTPKEFKKITFDLANGLETFDSRVNNPSRLIRMPYTRHQTTGLFKTRIALDELDLSMSEISKLAIEEYDHDTFTTVNLPDELKVLSTKEETVTADRADVIFTLDLSKRPSNLSNWKYALSEGFFPSGQRSNSLMILAATYHGLGFSKTKAYHLLKAAIELQANRYHQDKFDKKEMFTKIINQVYSDFWEGGTFSEENFPEELKRYFAELKIPRLDPKDVDESLIVDVEKGITGFFDYAVNIEKNTVKFGIPDLDRNIKVQKGHLIGILAGPGIGKTSLALTLLNNTSKNGVNSYFGSYDMYSNILFQKLLQRETGLSDSKIFETYKDRNEEKIKGFKEILKKNYENVTFCFKVGQTIDDIKLSIIRREQSTGVPIDLVIIDYIELVLTKSSDPTQASMEAVQGLREIANSGKVVVVLLQPNKISSKPDEPMLSYNCAKGSSAIAQAVTSMITCHRPGYSPINPELDNFFSINCVKNRMGPLFSADFSWDGPTGRIGQLEDIQREELAELREAKKLEKSEEV